MASTTGSLDRLQIGGLVSGSRGDRFGGIPRGLGKFHRIIRVARFPKSSTFGEIVGELVASEAAAALSAAPRIARIKGWIDFIKV